jgi:hypothetical protein
LPFRLSTRSIHPPRNIQAPRFPGYGPGELGVNPKKALDFGKVHCNRIFMNKKPDTSGKGPIRYEDGLAAAKIVSLAAAEAKSKVAICGGLALHIFGFTRSTKDVDLLGEKPLSFKELKKLNFGGIAYEVLVDGTAIEVDLIIRSDEIQELYQQALDTAKVNKTIGLRVVSPEFMVILKYLAGRGKDQIDLMWLLREDSLVDRTKVKAIISKQMGKHSYWALRDLDQLFLEADLLKARDQISE